MNAVPVLAGAAFFALIGGNIKFSTRFALFLSEYILQHFRNKRNV